jgi:hypothetical protein
VYLGFKTDDAAMAAKSLWIPARAKAQLHLHLIAQPQARRAVASLQGPEPWLIAGTFNCHS